MAKSKKAKEDREEKDEKDLRTPVARDGAYVMMLFVTLVAIITGCVCMYLDNEEYGAKSPPKEPPTTILKLGDKPAADPVAPKAADPAAPPAPPAMP
jgi:hypothetical protein